MEIKTNCIVEHDCFICVDAYKQDDCMFAIQGIHVCVWNVGDYCSCVAARKHAALEQMEFLKEWIGNNIG
jgi:hypothetical protein